MNRSEPAAARVLRVCCAWACALLFSARTLPASAQASPEAPATAPSAPNVVQGAAPIPEAAPESPAAIIDTSSEEIVITGSRIEEPARESLVTTDVIRRAEIERSGARNAAELLEERAGVQVTRGFAGSALWLRGLDPKYTLILVDGDRIPGQVNGAIDLTRFTVENIERIEIVRGPSSALYGSDAIGGVVNVITRQSTRPFEADGSVAYGQRHAFDAGGRIAGQLAKPLRLQLTGGFHSADAFKTAGAPVRGSAHEDANAALKLWFEPDARNRWVASATYLNQDFVGVDEGAGGAILDRTQLQEHLMTSIEHRLTADPRVQLVSRATYSLFREQYLSDQRGSRELDRYEDNREHLGQLTSLLSLALTPAHKSTIGLEQLFQVFDSERLAHRGQRYRLAPFAQHAWQVWKRGEARFDVVPGVRLDMDSQFGTKLSPKLALQYTPIETVVLRASYGRGFRAPSFQELLLRFENPSVGYVVSGNPNLNAETSSGLDVGVTWTPTESLEFATAFFRNDITDMIATVSGEMISTGTLYSYENLTSAWTMGVESSASWKSDEVFAIILGHTFMTTWDGEHDRVLEGRPIHRITGSVRLADPSWGLEFGARMAIEVGREYFVPGTDDVERPVTGPALASVDLRVSKHFTEHLEIAAGVDNLLDAGDRFTILRPRTVYGSIGGRY